jgi:FixJ family two-component response regulator
LSSKYVGYVVGLTDEQSSVVLKAVQTAGLKPVVVGDVATLFSRQDLRCLGAVVLPLAGHAGPGHGGPGEVRRFVDRLQEIGSPLKVVWIAHHVDVATIVEAVRAGAADVLAWPTDEASVESAVLTACRHSEAQEASWAATTAAQQKLAQLSGGERDVLELMLAGKVNKTVASRLGIALRTVENRRKKIFTKLDTRSLAEIVHLVRTAQGSEGTTLAHPMLSSTAVVGPSWDRAAG